MSLWSRAQTSVAPAHRRGTLEDPRDAPRAWPQAPDAGRCASRGIRFVTLLSSCEALVLLLPTAMRHPVPASEAPSRSVVRSSQPSMEIQGREGKGKATHAEELRKRGTTTQLWALRFSRGVSGSFPRGKSRRRKSGVEYGVEGV